MSDNELLVWALANDWNEHPEGNYSDSTGEVYGALPNGGISRSMRAKLIEELRLSDAVKKETTKKSAGLCPICNGPMSLRSGRYGQFYGCNNYPDCKGTAPAAEPAIVDLKSENLREHLQATLDFVRLVGGFAKAHDWIGIAENTSRALEKKNDPNPDPS